MTDGLFSKYPDINIKAQRKSMVNDDVRTCMC